MVKRCSVAGGVETELEVCSTRSANGRCVFNSVVLYIIPTMSDGNEMEAPSVMPLAQTVSHLLYVWREYSPLRPLLEDEHHTLCCCLLTLVVVAGLILAAFVLWTRGECVWG